MDFNSVFNSFANRSSLSEKKTSLLLHTCCVPCLLGCIERVVPFFDVTLFFYNPNIDTKAEFDLRLRQLDKVMKAFEGIKVVALDYDHTQFLTAAFNQEQDKEGGARCKSCFDLRLFQTFKYASENSFDAFATTLTLSPHKNATLINSIGESIASAASPIYIPSDFKKQEGVKRSSELCREWGIYRQGYCGCNL